MSGPVIHVFGATRLTPALPLTPKQRTILAVLALHHPHPVTVSELTDHLWAGDPPATARAAVQNQISRLRARLADGNLETHPAGYRWTGTVDVANYSDDLLRIERLLAVQPDAAFDAANRLLSTATGEPFADLSDGDDVVAARHHARCVLYALENLRAEAALECGAHQWSLVEAERLAAAAPHDEGRCLLSVQALEKLGRRADALAAIASFRRRMRDDLGLATSDLLDRTERDLFERDAPIHDRFRSGEPVGREAELDEIFARLDAGDDVIVEGEPGIGVSTLLSLVASGARRHGWTVAMARSSPAAEATPLAVLDDLMVGLGRPASDYWRILPEFVPAVVECATTSRVLLVVDDIDTAGPSTHRALIEASAHPGVALVAGTHVRGSSSWAATSLRLSGLPMTAIARIVADSGGDPTDSTLLQEHMAATAGNPLLLHGLIRAGEVSDQTSGDPSTLAEIVRARLQRLSPAARDALNWAAVASDTIPSDVVGRAVPELHRVSAEDPDLLSGGQLRLRHPAVRDIVYAEIPDGYRREIHHALVTVARDAALSPGVVLHHAVEAAPIDPHTAVDAAWEAASDASLRGAHLDAAAALAAALAAVPGDMLGADRLAMEIARGDALRLAGEADHLPILQGAAAEALDSGRDDDLVDAMFALLQLGATSGVADDDPTTSDLLTRTLDRLRNPEHIALVRGAASLTMSMNGDAHGALAMFDRAETLATDPVTRRAVLPFAYLALGHPDHRERRARLTDELISAGEHHDDPRALWEGLHQRFSQHALAGDGAAMKAIHDEMVSLMPRLGDVGRAWSIRYQEAALAHLAGDHDRSESLAFDAYRLFAPVSEPRAAAALQGQILGIRLSQDRTVELADALAEMLDQQPTVPAWHAARAHAVARDQPDVARDHLHQALANTQRDFTWLATHSVGALAAATVEDLELCRAFLLRLEPYTGLACWQGTCVYGPVDAALAAAASIVGDERARVFRERAENTAARLEACTNRRP